MKWKEMIEVFGIGVAMASITVGLVITFLILLQGYFYATEPNYAVLVSEVCILGFGLIVQFILLKEKVLNQTIK